MANKNIRQIVDEESGSKRPTEERPTVRDEAIFQRCYLRTVVGKIIKRNDDTTSPSTSVERSGYTSYERYVRNVADEGLENRRPTTYAVSLVNTDIDESFVVRPERREGGGDDEQLPISPTLESLRKGMAAYTKTKNGNPTEDDEFMEIFCCKLPKHKQYYFYKRVKIVGNLQSDSATTGVVVDDEKKSYSTEEEETFNVLYENFRLIRHYVKCFAVLAEFNFEFCLIPPWADNGLPNVLVVDKVWKYDENKRLYIPSYEPIEGDSYTDYVVASIKKFYSCDALEFISTLHTSLFANNRALQDNGRRRTPSSQRPATAEVRPSSSSSSSSSSAAAAVIRPPKKRKLEPSFDSQTNERSKRTQREYDEDRGRLQNDGETRQESSSLSNPTLIVFKQNFRRRESILVCPISVEIHLSTDVVYSR